uniref:hypothetical protein n=1 Tax=Umezakia ovalisporum TaxID=75695 RepID=UPI0039C613A1
MKVQLQKIYAGQLLPFIVLMFTALLSYGQRAGDIDRTFNYGRGTNYSYLIGTGPNSTVSMLQPIGNNRVLIYGSFTGVHGLERHKNAARINSSTGELDTSFILSGFTGNPIQILEDSGKTLVVGSLNPVNNNNRGIAR